MKDQALILIVDDEPFNVDYLEQELEDLGYDTASAGNGQQALEQVAALAPDMILLDIMMPVMDGFAVLAQLKENERWRDIPVVIISAMNDMDSVVRGIEMGAEDYLPKPFDPVLLEARLTAGLEKKRLRDQEVEYLEQVAQLTQAAQAVEENNFDPRSLAIIAARSDALGNLGRVFQRMAQEVHAREQRLKQQIAQLQLDRAERQIAADDSPLMYLPMDRRQALATGATLPESATGALLFADVSGFTPLTAALAKALGSQRGAEEMVRQLNRVFGAMIAQVHAYAGSVIGFSGDAITCWFAPDPSLPDERLRATAAGLQMLAEMGTFGNMSAAGIPVSLDIKVAVAAGPVRRFLVGNARHRLIEVIAGRVLTVLADAEHAAGRGELVIPLSLAQSMAEQVVVAEERSQPGGPVAVISGLRSPVDTAPWPPLPAPGLTPEQARPWLLPPVFERVVAGQSDYLAELRPATALFLRFQGLDEESEASVQQLDAYVKWVESVLDDTGGHLIQLTIGEKGSFLYAVYGAPLAQQDDANRAVEAALKLRQSPPDLVGVTTCQIGLCRGLMRAGAYGAAARRTYGAIGDATNMAARLMQMAGDAGILADASVYTEARQRFEFETLPPLKVKGKQEALTVYRPLAARSRADYRRQLDDLPPPLQVAIKRASVLGDQFSLSWLEALHNDETARAALPAQLAQLIGLGLMQRADSGEYRFADGLLRETAYDTMLFAQRRGLHRAAARWLEASYADDLAPCSAVLAHHWLAAEDTGRAVQYLEMAGQYAQQNGDQRLATHYYQQALELDKVAGATDHQDLTPTN